MGNSNGAKFDLTQNYLRDAQLTGNAGVFSNQRVTDIAKTLSGYAVSVEKLSPAGSVVDKYTLECEYLVLGAGSIGSVELLMKAREKKLITGLQSNTEIGLGWGSNGDSIVTRSFSPIRGVVQAAPSSSLVHDNDGRLPVSLEAWYVPGVPMDIGIQGSLSMDFDMENRGRFVYDSSRDVVDLDWPKNGNDLAVEATRRVNNRFVNAEPKSLPGVPLFAPDVWAGFTAHPLGGAVIGKATDRYGRVKGTEKLYVMDGALIPGSTGAVNPSLTISALVERNIEKVISEDF